MKLKEYTYINYYSYMSSWGPDAQTIFMGFGMCNPKVTCSSMLIPTWEAFLSASE
jgi:hypothetical protein